MKVDPIDPVTQAHFHFEALLKLLLDREARGAIAGDMPKFLAMMLACTPVDKQEIGLKLFNDSCREHLREANAVVAEAGERR